MLVASKTDAINIKKSRELLISALFIGIIITISLYFYFAELPLDERTTYVQIPVPVALFSCFVASIVTVLGLGLKSPEGKYYLSLVIATGLWFCAQLIWAYYEILENFTYPNLADFFWLVGYLFLGYHFFRSFRFWKQAKVIKLYSIIGGILITSIIIGTLLYFSFKSGADTDLVPTIVSNLYVSANGILLTAAIVILWNLKGRDIFLLHRILICGFLVINMLGDVSYTFEVLVEDAYVEHEWIWGIIYTISFLVLLAGLIWYNKISTTIKKNIEMTVDRHYPHLEKLWNKTSNSQESDLSEYESGPVEHFTSPELIDNKMENTLRKTKEEILFLISTKDVLLKMQTRIYKLIKIISKLNVDVRILIPESEGLQDLSFGLKNYSGVKLRYLYKPLTKDHAVFVIDSNAILDLEFKKKEDILNGDEELLVYSEREARVQSHLALFENCWILPLVHERIASRQK